MNNNLVKFITEKISYLISPPYCDSCKSFLNERQIFCKNCFEKIKPILSVKHQITSKYCMQVFAISDYNEPIKSLILAKAGSNQLAAKRLGQLIWQMTNLQHISFDYLIPVPLHWTRYVKRGFNQTEIMALEISKNCNKPVKDILIRKKYTKFQSSLSVADRMENVKSAFDLKVSDEIIFKEKNLLLVDDLFTSGATLINAAKELTKLNPKSINAVVACRVI